MRKQLHLVLFCLIGACAVVSPFAMIPPQHISVTAYLSKYNWEEAIDSLRMGIATPNEISPQWYTIGKSGSIEPIAGAHVDEAWLTDFAHAQHLAIKPILANLSANVFEPSLVLALLARSDDEEKLSHEIVELVLGRGYDGIVLDLEGLKPEKLVGLVASLANELHAHNKTLGVIMEPRSVSVRDTWYQIGKSADSVQLISYDEHNAGTGPGPIASLDFVRRNLDAALKAIPLEKLTLGIGVYAAYWNQEGHYGSGSWESIIKNNRDISPDTIGLHVVRGSDEDGAMVFTSIKDLNWNMTYHYDDGVSVERKVLLARKAGITHIALWHLGGEDPDIWTRLKTLNRWHFRSL